jgi:hypothetical protein
MSKLLWFLIVVAFLINCSKKDNPIQIQKQYDERLIGTYVTPFSWDGSNFMDTLIFGSQGYNNGHPFLLKIHDYKTMFAGPGQMDTIGFTQFQEFGDWNTINDSINFQVSFYARFDTSGTLLEGYSNTNAQMRQYLFNFATELWIWNGNIKKIWTRID